MTGEALVQEGDRLCKTCILLTEEPQEGGIVGFWGGSGRPDIPQDLPPFINAITNRRHWLTINSALLGKLGFNLPGTFSLYEDERSEGGSVGTVFHAREMDFCQLKMDGVPLYAKPSKSFPPFEAVCLYGSSAVEAWLKSQGLERHDYNGVRNELYDDVWRKRCPLFTEEYAAVLGGWHTLWPEDDFYTPREMKLLIWTFKDSEPWAEVWWRQPNFKVKYRFT